MLSTKVTFRWFLLLTSFSVVGLVLVNTYLFLQKFEEEERVKMSIWGSAEEELLKSADLNDDLGNLTIQVLSSNTTTPMILTDPKQRVMDFRNIAINRTADSVSLKKLILQFSKENEPIEIIHNNVLFGYLYYGDSSLLKTIRYFPLVVIIIALLFGLVMYLFYSADKTAEQNLLWAGMAKETAHQIGTPLSSLVGWVEILKQEKVSDDILTEIKKDIERLNIITDRFSKIGSLPLLVRKDLVVETQAAFDYLSGRFSKMIRFELSLPEHPVFINLNSELYNWTIENLIKNGIDAMKGKGLIRISMEEDEKWVRVLIADKGSGIPKKLQKSIFSPGFTTKKRGWGLGLSLAKRIVEEYHQGQLQIKYTEPGKGTVMQISLRKIEIP